MMPVKICGITQVLDAEMAVDNGASAVGMIFYDDSPRNVEAGKALEIATAINGKAARIGVFVNEDIERIRSIVTEINLDMVQLHGDESPEYCENLELPVIKVFRVGDTFYEDKLKTYNVDAFLFDTYKKGLPGGTGDVFNWDALLNLNIETPIILSGGLNPENILEGIHAVQPSAVDVNSGIENYPGEKNEGKIQELFKSIKGINTQKNIFDPFIWEKNNV